MTSEIRSASRAASVLLPATSALCAQTPALGTVEGTVTDAASGKPLPGARIKLSTQRAGDQHFSEADNQGRFHVEGIDLATHYLTAQYPGYMNPGSTPTAEAYSTQAALSAANTHVELQVRLQAYAVLSGRVTDAVGAPAEGIRVDLLVRRPANPSARPAAPPRIMAGEDVWLAAGGNVPLRFGFAGSTAF